MLHEGLQMEFVYSAKGASPDRGCLDGQVGFDSDL